MGNYVVELNLGVGRERFFLSGIDDSYAVTPQQRNARQYHNREAAVTAQNMLLQMGPRKMASLIRKDSDYDIPLSISVISNANPDVKDFVSRRKTYSFH
jgi:hypothetical protein